MAEVEKALLLVTSQKVLPRSNTHWLSSNCTTQTILESSRGISPMHAPVFTYVSIPAETRASDITRQEGV